jgi:hypothetical protein
LAVTPSAISSWDPTARVATWRDTCLFERINHALITVDRERAGRQVSPSAAIIGRPGPLMAPAPTAGFCDIVAKKCFIVTLPHI